VKTIHCKLCGAGCTIEDYCFGCHAHICEGCDNPNVDQRPQGSEHAPEAHLERGGAPS